MHRKKKRNHGNASTFPNATVGLHLYGLTAKLKDLGGYFLLFNTLFLIYYYFSPKFDKTNKLTEFVLGYRVGIGRCAAFADFDLLLGFRFLGSPIFSRADIFVIAVFIKIK